MKNAEMRMNDNVWWKCALVYELSSIFHSNNSLTTPLHIHGWQCFQQHLDLQFLLFLTHTNCHHYFEHRRFINPRSHPS